MRGFSVEGPVEACGKNCGTMGVRAPGTAIFLALLFSIECLGQAPAKLGDSFARAALLALKALETDTIEEHNPKLKDRMEAADVEASSGEEIAALAFLKKIYVTHAIVGQWKDLRLEYYLADTHAANEELARTVATRKAEADTEFVKISRLEGTCFTDMEATLRQRVAGRPKSCEDVSKAALLLPETKPK